MEAPERRRVMDRIIRMFLLETLAAMLFRFKMAEDLLRTLETHLESPMEEPTLDLE